MKQISVLIQPGDTLEDFTYQGLDYINRMMSGRNVRLVIKTEGGKPIGRVVHFESDDVKK